MYVMRKYVNVCSSIQYKVSKRTPLPYTLSTILYNKVPSGRQTLQILTEHAY